MYIYLQNYLRNLVNSFKFWKAKELFKNNSGYLFSQVSALADINRPDDALPILRSVLEIEGPQENKHTFCTDVVRYCNINEIAC